ncbi:MAG: hypothetical protein JWO31_1544 [Phycisphaerales bacterium]|nr:hypothetical protein [Phycisphaerales bacterium]
MRLTISTFRVTAQLAALFVAFVAVPQARGQSTRPEATQPAAASAHGLRVFTAGHSFHVPIIGPLAQIAAAGGFGDHAVAGRQMIGGSSVTQHWALPPDKNLAKQALTAGRADVLTLSPFLPLPDTAIDRYADLMLAHNPAGRVTVQASWVPQDGLLIGRFANAQRDTADLKAVAAFGTAYANQLREQIDGLNARYVPQVGHQAVYLVPVGDAVVRLRERVAGGKVAGIAKQSDLFRDDYGHGREPVYVLAAYCHYAVIYGRNPIGLSVPDALAKTQGLSKGDAAAVNRVLQEVAWEAVTAEPASGVTVANAAK